MNRYMYIVYTHRQASIHCRTIETFHVLYRTKKTNLSIYSLERFHPFKALGVREGGREGGIEGGGGGRKGGRGGEREGKKDTEREGGGKRKREG